MNEWLPLLTSAFIAGFLGSAHCLGMCAGMSGLFAAGTSDARMGAQLRLSLTYNIGRIVSYSILGSGVAFLGKSAVIVIPDLAGPVRIAAGIMIVLIGLQVALRWPLLALVEKGGAHLWRRIAPLTKAVIPASTASKAFGLGLIWGWLPCGLVYSALLLAATTAEPVQGGLVMLAFGLGTMPAMVSTGLGAAKLSAMISRYRIGAGLLIIVLGLATLAMPLQMTTSGGDHSGHTQHQGL